MSKILFFFLFLIVCIPAFAQETNCSDGVDNDGDGLVDCYDSDCDSDVACNPTSCLDGAIGVSGSGCGCLGGCDLTAYGGPDCGGGVGGNCDAGYQSMSVLIFVPDGCTYTVDAVMEPRPGCSASGADGSCATCDAMKVDVQGGGKPMLFGGSNSSLSDNYTLTGPGYIEVSGSANRADEIISYTITPSGGTCPNCQSVLPIDLKYFSAERVENNVHVNWFVSGNLNVDYYAVERSIDGTNFSPLGYMNTNNNSSNKKQYTVVDSEPINDQVSYYRLIQYDNDGYRDISKIISVKPLQSIEVVGYYNSLGQKVPPETSGIVIIRYSDGSLERRYQP